MPRISLLPLLCATVGLLPSVHADAELGLLQFEYEIDVQPKALDRAYASKTTEMAVTAKGDECAVIAENIELE